MSAEFDQLVAQFEQFQSKMKRVDDKFASIGEMQGELSELEATASSADRSITVVAGPGGSIKDIQLSDAALRQRPEALAQALLSTVHQAVAESARKQAGIVDAHLGGDLDLTEQVLQTQAEVLGTSVEDLRARMAESGPSAQRPPSAEQHDDYSEQSVLRPADPGRDRPASPPPSSGGGSAGDDFLKNLFDEDDRR